MSESIKPTNVCEYAGKHTRSQTHSLISFVIVDFVVGCLCCLHRYARNETIHIWNYMPGISEHISRARKSHSCEEMTWITGMWRCVLHCVPPPHPHSIFIWAFPHVGCSVSVGSVSVRPTVCHPLFNWISITVICNETAFVLCTTVTGKDVSLNRHECCPKSSCKRQESIWHETYLCVHYVLAARPQLNLRSCKSLSRLYGMAPAIMIRCSFFWHPKKAFPDPDHVYSTLDW